MITAFATSLWQIMLELSPALLLGLLIAGILHVFLPPGLVSRHLSRGNSRSVLRSVLLGIPMPLCSCGVIPTAIGLRNDGASKGAATGFLISSPQTSIDSILVSASFLGWPFALFKVLAAFVTGMTVVHHHRGESGILQLTCAVILSALLIFLLGRRLFRKPTAAVSIIPDKAHAMTIRVRGMTCNHCVNTVKNALEEVAGVEEAVPNLTTGTVLIRGDNIDTNTLLEAIKEAGYNTD